MAFRLRKVRYGVGRMIEYGAPIRAFPYAKLDRKRSNVIQRAVFSSLTNQTPEQYVRGVDKTVSVTKQLGTYVAKRRVAGYAMAGASWIMMRSPRAAVVVGARAIPYVGIGLLAYDVYRLFD